MKIHSKNKFILKVLLIVFLAFVAAYLMQVQLYFSAAFASLFILIVVVSMLYDRKRLIDRVDQLIKTIHYDDLTTHFVQKDEKDELNKLSIEMNEALEEFRVRNSNALRSEAEANAWQKLTRVLTHEIMNSIAPIISLSETLSEQDEKTMFEEEDYLQMQEAMKIINRRSQGLVSFIDNYRKITHIPTPTVSAFDLEQFFESLKNLLLPSSIVFSYSVYPESLPLKADKILVEQVLINLLKNAHEACVNCENPKIELKAEKIGNEIHISVIDNGQAVSAEVLEKIFIPFYSTKSNGAGIGLSICQQIMLRHKGKLIVKSDERNTRFIAVFPD